MKSFKRRVKGRSERHGLAPVELVLALPVWMLIASAMVIVGHLGAWKIRGHVAVREAASRAQWPRTREADGNSAEWTRPSSIMQSRPAATVEVSDPLTAHPVIRGPQLAVPGTGVGMRVDGSVMKPQSEAIAGEAFLNEPPPVWAKSGVRIGFGREFPVLDGNTGQWAPSGMGGLRSTRIWSLPTFE
jgi:hypothetical protein